MRLNLRIRAGAPPAHRGPPLERSREWAACERGTVADRRQRGWGPLLKEHEGAPARVATQHDANDRPQQAAAREHRAVSAMHVDPARARSTGGTALVRSSSAMTAGPRRSTGALHRPSPPSALGIGRSVGGRPARFQPAVGAGNRSRPGQAPRTVRARHRHRESVTAWASAPHGPSPPSAQGIGHGLGERPARPQPAIGAGNRSRRGRSAGISGGRPARRGRFRCRLADRAADARRAGARGSGPRRRGQADLCR